VALRFILQQFQQQSWLLVPIATAIKKELFGIQMLQTLLETGDALVQHAELLVAQAHIVLDQQKYELVMFIFVCCDLIEHCLSFLKQN
jgi:hypothetical protein